jgi:hypothetical protein
LLFEALRFEQEFELSGVKPYPLTVTTVIKLDVMILNDYQIVFAGRAYHGFQTLSQAVPISVDAVETHVKAIAQL